MEWDDDEHAPTPWWLYTLAWMFAAALVLLMGVMLFADPPHRVRQRQSTLTELLELAARDLEQLPEHDRYQSRYVTFWTGSADDAVNNKRVMRWWLTQMTFARSYVPPVELDARLWRIDLRDYRWNAAAWQVVAERDPYMTQPLIPDKLADRLRDAIGYKLSEKQAKAGKLPVVAVVRADWMFRETVESNRSTAYYDLLFARQRHGGRASHHENNVPIRYTRVVFVGARPPADTSDLYGLDVDAVWMRTEDYDFSAFADKTPRSVIVAEFADGTKLRWDADEPLSTVASYVRSNQYRSQYAKQEDKANNFPATEDEWNVAFGIKDTIAFLDKEKIDLKTGAVVTGSADDPAFGSIVARNNRVLVFLPIPTGAALKTFDVQDIGKKNNDFVEGSANAVKGKINFDAGELLASLPNGGLASFLINKERKRVERGDIDVVHNKVDSRFQDVRNPMGCVICHAPEGGFIEPRNLIKDVLEAGVDLKFADRDQRNHYRNFFLQEDRFKVMRVPYEKLIEVTTAEPGQSPWKPAELVNQFQRWRDQYDDPVDLATAARELNTDETTLRGVLIRSPLARLSAIMQGIAVPRGLWEASLHQEAARLLAQVPHGLEAVPKRPPIITIERN